MIDVLETLKGAHPNITAEATRALVNHDHARNMNDLERALKFEFEKTDLFDQSLTSKSHCGHS
jgi:hypothetical protein